MVNVTFQVETLDQDSNQDCSPVYDGHEMYAVPIQCYLGKRL